MTRVIRDPWIVKIIRNYLHDTIAARYWNRPSGGFVKTEEGLLTFVGKVYILTTLRTELVTEIYELPAYGHQGIRKTKEQVARNYYFPGLRKTVETVVRGYDMCI